MLLPDCAPRTSIKFYCCLGSVDSIICINYALVVELGSVALAALAMECGVKLDCFEEQTTTEV